LEIGALVRSDQAGVACRIGGKDRSEPAGLAHPPRQPPVADPQAQAGPQLADSMASLPPPGRPILSGARRQNDLCRPASSWLSRGMTAARAISTRLRVHLEARPSQSRTVRALTAERW
jgi:hypothetical protein